MQITQIKTNTKPPETEINIQWKEKYNPNPIKPITHYPTHTNIKMKASRTQLNETEFPAPTIQEEKIKIQTNPIKRTNHNPTHRNHKLREKKQQKTNEIEPMNPMKRNRETQKLTQSRGRNHTSSSHRPNQRTEAKKGPIVGSNRPQTSPWTPLPARSTRREQADALSARKELMKWVQRELTNI